MVLGNPRRTRMSAFFLLTHRIFYDNLWIENIIFFIMKIVSPSRTKEQTLFFWLTCSVLFAILCIFLHLIFQRSLEMSMNDFFLIGLIAWFFSLLIFWSINKDKRPFRQTVHFSLITALLCTIGIFGIVEGTRIFFVLTMGAPILLTMNYALAIGNSNSAP